MLSSQLILDVHHELMVDNFAGGGGASTGIELATGRHVDHAINHDLAALGMHRINHPQTVHHCEDVFDVDPITVTEGRPVGLGWFSPDCKHFSKAKGGRPVSKKIRGLAFVMLRWAKIRTRVIYMENVEEIQTWGPLGPDNKPDKRHSGRTWRAFLAALASGVAADHPDLPEMLEVLGDSVTREELIRGFGYHVETRELRACDYGAPTIRKRLFLIARCDGRPIVWPAPTHATPEVAKKTRLKPWRTVAECIDWHIPCHSIFLTREEARKFRCKRPLAASTLRRIAKGIHKYVMTAKRPFLVNLTHQGGDRVESVDEPARTLTGAHRGEKAFVDASVAPFVSEHANSSNNRNMPADGPLRTQCAEVKGGHFSMVSAHLCREFGESIGQTVEAQAPTVMPHGQGKSSIVAANMVKFRGDPETHPPSRPAHEPLDTVSAAGLHHGLSVAYLAQHNDGFNTNPGHPANKPASTISATGSQQGIVAGSVVKYYGTDQDPRPDEPLHSVTTRDRFGFSQAHAVCPDLTPEQLAGARRVAAFLREYGVEFEGEFATVESEGIRYVIVDIGMRMLTPRELFRAQGFPESYVIDRAWIIDPQTGELTEITLTKEQQIRMCGNSVCPPVAAALVAANSPELCILGRRGKSQPLAPTARPC